MNVTLTARIEIETDAQPTEEQLIADFDGYMGECLNLPHGNVFDHNTGRDEGEIRMANFTIEKKATSLEQSKSDRIGRGEEITLGCDEIYVLKILLLNAWSNRSALSFQEQFGDISESEDWLNDVITDLTEKVKITPEETW